MLHVRRTAWRFARITSIGVALFGLSASDALAAGTLTVAPDQVDFGTHAFGANATRTFVVTNGGPDLVVLSEVALGGGVDPFDFVAGSCEPGVVVDVGETCEMEVAFSPIGFQAASYQAFLLAAGGWQDHSATALLTATTQAVTPLSATPTTLSADGTPRTRPTATVQIRNDAGIALPISYPDVAGPFTMRAPTCGGELAPGATCSVGIALQPPRRAAWGSHTGALTVRTVDYSLVVPLTGTYSRDPAPTLPPPRKRSPRWPVEIRLGDLTDAVPALIRGGPSRARLLPAFDAGEAGRLSLTVFGWRKARRLRIGGGALKFPSAQSGRLRLALNRKGRALLRRSQRTRIKVVAKFEPHDDVVSRQGPEFLVKAPAEKRRRR